MWFSANGVVLPIAQAACIALPGAGLPHWTRRFRTRAWALVLPLSIAVVVVAIGVIPATADALTWVALLLVPPGCALALGWAARGARPLLAVLALPLPALVWEAPHTRVGEVAAIVLIAGSAITLGRLGRGHAAAAAARRRHRDGARGRVAGVLGRLRRPTSSSCRVARAGLPQLQSASFGTSGLGYGDFFAAAVVGGIFAAERDRNSSPRSRMVVVSLAWNQLFLVYDILPATIPPALVLVAVEVIRRRRGPACHETDTTAHTKGTTPHGLQA